jgi:MFS superfamily sulfate permease-like transporter
VLGLFDISGLRAFWAMSRREAAISAITTLGVLVLGVLPGVLLAVMLSLGWLLSRALKPNDAVLGRVPGVAGFHNVADFPGAETIPGLLLYRFEANVVFFNVDVFCARLEAAIAAQEPPVEWVVVDLAPVSLIDATGLERFDELRRSLAERGVKLCVTNARRNLARSFEGDWARTRVGARPTTRFDTLQEALAAFEARGTDPSGGAGRSRSEERIEDEQEEQGRG